MWHIVHYELDRKKMTELSIICTCYNDALIIPDLVKQIIQYVQPLGCEYEIILINDHSRDSTEQIIEELSKSNPFIKGVSLSRNYGQQIAISSGLHFCKGKYVVIMDGDMQNPPSAIPVLYQNIKEGYDIVYCTSKVRNNFLMEIQSRIFWFVVIHILRIKIVRNQLMMRIMTADYIQHFNRYTELTRAVAGITHDIGGKFTVIEVENKPRIIGKSNTTVFHRLQLMVDLLFNLTHQPLNYMIYLGFFSFIITFCKILYDLYNYFIYNNITPGYTSTILSIFLFGSLIITMLGIIARYLANIYLEVKNRPLFLVQKKFNLE